MNVSFNIVGKNAELIQMDNASASVCIDENYVNSICSKITFNPKIALNKIEGRLNIDKASAGKHEIKVVIYELKINQSLGFFTITAPAPSQACDTLHSYTGKGNGNILFKGKYYLNSSLKEKGINLTLIEKNAKYADFEISKDKCPAQKLMVYVGKAQNFTFCDGTKAYFNLLDWDSKVPNSNVTQNSNQASGITFSEAILDVIICNSGKEGKQSGY